MNTASFFNLALNTRINYKGFQEMKGRQFGTLSGLGMMRIYQNAYDIQIPYQLFNRYYRHMAESKSFTGWKTFKGK